MYFYANQQNFESMQFQYRSMPFGGNCAPSMPQTCMPQTCMPQTCMPQPQVCMPQPQICPPQGGNYLAEANFFWNQCMQAQQSLYQGWQQFCGCSNNSGPQWGNCAQPQQPQQPQWGNCGQPQQPQQPQWGNCEQPQWGNNCQPPEIHVHHHYVQDECPPQPAPQPAPQPVPQPLPVPLTRTQPALPEVTSVYSQAVVAQPLPPSPPTRRPFQQASMVNAMSPRPMGMSPMNQRPYN